MATTTSLTASLRAIDTRLVSELYEDPSFVESLDLDHIAAALKS